MKLPKIITDRIAHATEKEIDAVKSLACSAAKLESDRQAAWDKYETLKIKEPVRAGLVARALESYGAGQDESRERYFLAQVLCLLGGGIQRGKFTDEEVFESQGDKGDAEWTARARASVREIVAYISTTNR